MGAGTHELPCRITSLPLSPDAVRKLPLATPLSHHDTFLSPRDGDRKLSASSIPPSPPPSSQTKVKSSSKQTALLPAAGDDGRLLYTRSLGEAATVPGATKSAPPATKGEDEGPTKQKLQPTAVRQELLAKYAKSRWRSSHPLTVPSHIEGEATEVPRVVLERSHSDVPPENPPAEPMLKRSTHGVSKGATSIPADSSRAAPASGRAAEPSRAPPQPMTRNVETKGLQNRDRALLDQSQRPAHPLPLSALEAWRKRREALPVDFQSGPPAHSDLARNPSRPRTPVTELAEGVPSPLPSTSASLSTSTAFPKASSSPGVTTHQMAKGQPTAAPHASSPGTLRQIATSPQKDGALAGARRRGPEALRCVAPSRTHSVKTSEKDLKPSTTTPTKWASSEEVHVFLANPQTWQAASSVDDALDNSTERAGENQRKTTETGLSSETETHATPLDAVKHQATSTQCGEAARYSGAPHHGHNAQDTTYSTPNGRVVTASAPPSNVNSCLRRHQSLSLGQTPSSAGVRTLSRQEVLLHRDQHPASVRLSSPPVVGVAAPQDRRNSDAAALSSAAGAAVRLESNSSPSLRIRQVSASRTGPPQNSPTSTSQQRVSPHSGVGAVSCKTEFQVSASAAHCGPPLQPRQSPPPLVDAVVDATTPAMVLSTASSTGITSVGATAESATVMPHSLRDHKGKGVASPSPATTTAALGTNSSLPNPTATPSPPGAAPTPQASTAIQSVRVRGSGEALSHVSRGLHATPAHTEERHRATAGTAAAPPAGRSPPTSTDTATGGPLLSAGRESTTLTTSGRRKPDCGAPCTVSPAPHRRAVCGVSTDEDPVVRLNRSPPQRSVAATSLEELDALERTVEKMLRHHARLRMYAATLFGTSEERCGDSIPHGDERGPARRVFEEVSPGASHRKAVRRSGSTSAFFTVAMGGAAPTGLGTPLPCASVLSMREHPSANASQVLYTSEGDSDTDPWDAAAVWCGEGPESTPPPACVPALDLSSLFIPDDEVAQRRYRIAMQTAVREPLVTREDFCVSLGLASTGDLSGAATIDMEFSGPLPTTRRDNQTMTFPPQGTTPLESKESPRRIFTGDSDALDGGRAQQRERSRAGRVQRLLLVCREQRLRMQMCTEVTAGRADIMMQSR